MQDEAPVPTPESDLNLMRTMLERELRPEPVESRRAHRRTVTGLLVLLVAELSLVLWRVW